MAKKSGDTFEEYAKKLAAVKLDINSRLNLQPISDEEAIVNDKNIAKLVAEGNALLAEEEKRKEKKPAAPLKDESKKLETKLATTSSNPYVRARMEVLQKMAEDKRAIIEKMEKGSLPKDSRYEEFCKQVRIRGDQLSDLN